jgi:hypothetical protein
MLKEFKGIKRQIIKLIRKFAPLYIFLNITKMHLYTKCIYTIIININQPFLFELCIIYS